MTRRNFLFAFLVLAIIGTTSVLFGLIQDPTRWHQTIKQTYTKYTAPKAEPAPSHDEPPALIDLMVIKKGYPRPQIDFTKYKNYPAINSEGSRNAFATLLCSRDGGLNDPYWATAQSIVWRLLWSWHASRKYPVIVFVCPFVPTYQRDVLRGQGAIVHELPLLDGIIDDRLISIRRWVDQFSKLNMWSFTQYDKIAYLDSDAFPVDNLDDVFDLVETRTCIREKLDEPMDQCEYSFAGVAWFDPFAGVSEVNGGFIVFSPNEEIHKRLLRNCQRTEEYPFAHMEQSFLNSTLGFGYDSPFPGQLLDVRYNLGMEDYWDHDNLMNARVLHAKLWVQKYVENHPFLRWRWDTDWMTLCVFYDDPAFPTLRAQKQFQNVDLKRKQAYEEREKRFLVDMAIARQAVDKTYFEECRKKGVDPLLDPSITG